MRVNPFKPIHPKTDDQKYADILKQRAKNQRQIDKAPGKPKKD